MSYETPKYKLVSEKEWARAVPDIREYNAISDAIANFVRDFSTEMEQIIWETANDIVQESRLDYAPVRTGRLRSNIRAEFPETSAQSVSVNMVSDVPYAPYVHEYHKTRSKYLEEPFMQIVDSGLLEERIANAYLEKLGL